MTSTSGGSTSRQGRSLPPDRLAAVLDEVDRARRTGGWTPDEPADSGRREGRRPSSKRGSAVPGPRARERGEEGDGAPTGQVPRHLRVGRDQAVRPHTPLLRPPRSLQDAVIAPGRLAAVAVLVLLIAAGAVLGGRVLWLRATSEPQPADPPGAAATSSTGLQGTPRSSDRLAAQRTGSPGGATSAAPSTILVHVVGQVKRPGVVTLQPGARVREALKAAGGARSSADLGRLNLARPVADGEQLAVPKPGEKITPAPGPAGPGASATGGGTSSAGPGAQPAEPVNVNQADATALEALPGVGPVLAGRIVQWRTDNGPFTAVDELSEVSGIGEKMLAQLRPLVIV